MTIQKKTKKAPISQAQVSFRLSADLRKFYEQQAAAERRRLSDTLRIALEDRAAQLREEAQAA